MPYRRLPNTDQARVRALSTALEESDRQHLQLVISYQTQHEAKVLLQKFEQAIGLYKQTYDNQVNSNKDFQQIFRNARLYISHFIQVLNLAVQRSEIKKEYKKLYHLDPEDFSVPDMVSAESLIEWGQNIIEGEALRMKAGGVPLYNPAIAKVKVHYDIFKEYRDNQLFLQQNTARYGDKVNNLRQPIDDLILAIWNQIEGFFNELPPYKRMESCKQFGVIYYYRRGEAELTPADDLPKPLEVVEEVSTIEAVVAEQPLVAEAVQEQMTTEPIVIVDKIAAEEVVEEVEAPVVESEITVINDVDIPVEIVLETIVEPEQVAEDMSPALQSDVAEVTLFDDLDVKLEVSQEEPELKLNGVMPKKRKKRNAKQDELLSLFFQ
ncbi:MAG: hypothetical protein H6Q17_2507 [Bacteroidetes bacterium]|nr:hypothetical protein [Bacteroidota bacterium]